jgi:hypothetical protein
MLSGPFDVLDVSMNNRNVADCLLRKLRQSSSLTIDEQLIEARCESDGFCNCSLSSFEAAFDEPSATVPLRGRSKAIEGNQNLSSLESDPVDGSRRSSKTNLDIGKFFD